MTFPSEHLQGEILKKLNADKCLERVVHIRTTKKQTVKVNLENFLNVNIVVATLVATVAFAAAFQVPGGYDDNGQPILREKKFFLWFMISDSLAFGFSAASVFIQFVSSIIPKEYIFLYPKRLVLFLNELGILMALGAFSFGIRAVLAEKSSLATATVFSAVSSFFFSILGILIILWVKLKRMNSK